MKTIIAAICFCVVTTSHAQLPEFGWAKQLEGTNGKAITMDAAGNVYTLGKLSAAGNHDFDPGPGTFFLNGANGTGFISKLDNNGNFVSAIQLPTTGSGDPEGIHVDAALNIYVTGHYSLTQDFDPGPGVFNLTSAGQNDVYVLKLNAAGGFLWARSMGGPEGNISFSITVGNTGIVYTTGYFTGTSDFDPGPGVFSMTPGLQFDTYISALDANGNFLWAKQISGGVNQAHNIITTATGDLIISGQFNGTKDLDPGAGVFNQTSAGSSDIYILRLNAAGDFLGASAVGGIGTDVDEAVTVDVLGNMYVTGNFSFTPDFDPGPGVFNLTASGSSDIFVLKLDPTGGFIWAKQMTGPSGESGRDIKVDAAGNVYTTGLFVGTVDFDPGPATFNLTSLVNAADIFISKLDAAGNFVWAFRFGELSSDDRGNGIVLDALGNVYTMGNFDGQIDFDPGPGTAILIAGVTNVFVQRLGMSPVLPLTLVNFSGIASGNTSILEWQTVSEINTKYFEVEWCTDGQSYRRVERLQAAGNSTQNLRYNYTHSQPASGLNYYRLKMIDLNDQFTYSPVVRVRHVNTILSVNVFPNPVTNVLQLKIEAQQDETLDARILNAEGKTILSKSFILLPGTNNLDWNLQALPAGNYFIVFPGNRFETIKITKY